MADDTTQSQAPDAANKPDQSEIDRIIEQRLAREREQTAKKLKSLGFESWESLEQQRKQQSEAQAKAEEAERARLAEQNQFKTLYETEQKKREEREAELTRQLKELEGKHLSTMTQMHAERAQREIIAHASTAGAVAPDQLALLLSSRVKVDEQGALVVLGPDGKPATDGKGNALSVAELVNDFLAKNAHFVRAAPGAGAGGQAAGGASLAVDLKKVLASNNPAEIAKYEAQIIAAHSKTG